MNILIIILLLSVCAYDFWGGGSLPLRVYFGLRPQYAATPSIRSQSRYPYVLFPVIFGLFILYLSSTTFSNYVVEIYRHLILFYAIPVALSFPDDESIVGRYLFAVGVSMIFITQPISPSDAMLYSHCLAPIHILCSRVACLLLWASICCCHHRRPYLFFSWFAQGFALVFGMIWALDSAQWGSLFQWDFIELTALSLFIALYAWYHDDKSSFWQYVTLGIWILQWLTIYQLGLPTLQTRHMYGESHHVAFNLGVFFIYLFVLCIYLKKHHLRGNKHGSVVNFILHSVGCLLVLIIFMHAFLEIEFEHRILFILYGCIWAIVCLCYRQRYYKLSAAGGIVIGILFAFQPMQEISHEWAQLRGLGHHSLCELVGVRASSPSEYRITLECGGMIRSFPLPYDERRTSYTYKILPIHGHIYRIHAIQYRASNGVLMGIRNVTYEYLILLCIGLTGMISMVGMRRIVEPRKERLT